MHIVVVEESTTNCRVIRNSLAKMGYRNVAEFVQADVALKHLKQYRTDLLVTGKQLRAKTGFYLAKHVRDIPGYSSLPILMVASHYIHEDVLKGTDSGVTSFLVFPFSPKAFQRKVTTLIENYRSNQRKTRL